MAQDPIDLLPDMGFANGNIAGIQAFRAMLEESQQDGQDHTLRILRVICEAVRTVHESDLGSSSKSAAVKLLELVADSLEFRARHDDYGAWLDAKLIEAERFRHTVLRIESMRRHKKAQEDARFRSFMAGVSSM